MLGGIDYKTVAAAVRRALNPILGSNVGANGSVLTLDSTQSAGARWSLPGEASGVGRNIAARTNAVTPNTKFDMSADQLVVKDANGGAMVLNNVAVTVDMGVVGANGIEAGAQAINTWYYGWVIAKPDGTVAGLGSTSATAPTMPAGYTFKALVTAARSNGSTQFVKYRQLGNEVYYEQQNAVLSGGTATAETSVSTATYVPPIALAVQLGAEFLNTAGAGASQEHLSIRAVSGVTVTQMSVNATAGNTTYNGLCVWVPNISQNVYYAVTTDVAPSSRSSSIWVVGFKLPLGGE